MDIIRRDGNATNRVASRQLRADLEAVAAHSEVALATEQAAFIHAAVAEQNVFTLCRMAKAGMEDIPEAGPLVAPILIGYAHGAARRSQRY